MDVDADAFRGVERAREPDHRLRRRSPHDEVRDRTTASDRRLDVRAVEVGGGELAVMPRPYADDVAVDREDSGEHVTRTHPRAQRPCDGCGPATEVRGHIRRIRDEAGVERRRGQVRGQLRPARKLVLRVPAHRRLAVSKVVRDPAEQQRGQDQHGRDRPGPVCAHDVFLGTFVPPLGGRGCGSAIRKNPADRDREERGTRVSRAVSRAGRAAGGAGAGRRDHPRMGARTRRDPTDARTTTDPADRDARANQARAGTRFLQRRRRRRRRRS